MAPITRKTALNTNTQLLALDAGIKKQEKKYECILCGRKFASKAWVTRHFRTHRTRPGRLPAHTHPSCWPEAPATTPFNRAKVNAIWGNSSTFYLLPRAEQEAIAFRANIAEAGLSTKKQMEEKERTDDLRLWHWWFGVNQEALEARMEWGPKGLFPFRGEAVLSDRGKGPQGITHRRGTLLELADPAARTPDFSAVTYSFPSKPSTRLWTAGVRSDHGQYGHSKEGRVVADFTLASTRRLIALPVLSCISTSIIRCVGVNRENLNTVMQVAQAAATYLKKLGSDDNFTAELRNHFRDSNKYHHVMTHDKDEQWRFALLNAQQFREDRKFIWDLLVRATKEFFELSEEGIEIGSREQPNEHEAEVMGALKAFAGKLGDRETLMEIDKYMNRII